MFTKNHEVTIENGFAMDLVKVLGKYGIKFEVSQEYEGYLNEGRAWYRDFTIRANNRKMAKIMNEFYTNVKVN